MGVEAGDGRPPRGPTQGVAIRGMTKKSTLPKRPDGQLVAERNEIAVLKLVRDFGHLRRAEIARGVWPKSKSRVAEKMAQVTVQRLLAKGMLQEKPNSIGGRALVLAARGAMHLRMYNIEAQDGYDLSSVAGPHYWHRTLGTRYLIERAASGDQVFGEYALQKNFGPVGRGELIDRFEKLPDGIVLTPGARRGYDQSIIAADWIEVESSYKAENELGKIFAIAWNVGSWLNTAETQLLDRVIFVYDSRHRHENMVLQSLQRYMAKHPAANPDLLSSIVLVRCEVGIPLVWKSYAEFDSAHLLKANASSLSGTNE